MASASVDETVAPPATAPDGITADPRVPFTEVCTVAPPEAGTVESVVRAPVEVDELLKLTEPEELAELTEDEPPQPARAKIPTTAANGNNARLFS